MRASGAPWAPWIPADWDTLPFFAVFDESRTRNTGLTEKNLLSLSYGRIVRKDISSDQGLLPESFETYQIIEPDTLVFRFTDLQNDHRSLRTAKANERGIITSAYGAATPRRIDARFADYLLRGYDYLKVFYGFGGGVRQSLKLRDIARMPILLPPKPSQIAIADYLDRETAQIDTLIAKQKQLIATLRERQLSSQSYAVTQGLHNHQLIDSGVAWLGEVPEHWRQWPLWSLFERKKDVGHPEEQMLSVFRDLGVVVKSDHANLNQTAENRNIYQLVHPGWLVTNRMKAWQGSVGISSLRGIVSGHYICFVPRHAQNDRYLNWLFRSRAYAAGYATISRGVRIGQAEIDNDDYKVMPVLLPPVAEQIEIADHLDAVAQAIDALIAKAERFIELSKERRAALITAAVTGQIDIPA